MLGQTGIALSKIGLGCASLWGMESFDEATAIRIFGGALAAGVNLFDTGHNYSGGNAEVRLGKAIRSLGAQRRDLVLSSKCGTKQVSRWSHQKDFSPQWIRQSLEMSLERIGTDYLDLFLFHSPQIHHLTEEAMETIHALKRQGLVRAIGVSSPGGQVLTYICEHKNFDFVLLGYNILTQQLEPDIQKLHNQGIGVIGGSPLAHGLYSQDIFKIRSSRDLWYLARALKNFRGLLIKGRRYSFINRVDGFTGAQVALGYVLQNPCVSATIFGTTSEVHLQSNLKTADLSLPAGLIEKIRNA